MSFIKPIRHGLDEHGWRWVLPRLPRYLLAWTLYYVWSWPVSILTYPIRLAWWGVKWLAWRYRWVSWLIGEPDDFIEKACCAIICILILSPLLTSIIAGLSLLIKLLNGG